MTLRFAEWVTKNGTEQQKAAFASEFNSAVTGGALNFTPDTPGKLALWEAYCAATGQESVLPGPSSV
jgi:hypothetical protein